LRFAIIKIRISIVLIKKTANFLFNKRVIKLQYQNPAEKQKSVNGWLLKDIG